MAKNNIKLLTQRQLRAFDQIYRFDVNKDKVIVSIAGYNRVTLHDIDKPFTINAKIRKVTFTPEAVKMWKELKDDYSLIEVQQAINYLIVSYQTVNITNVRKALEFKFNIKNDLEGETE